MHRQETTHLPCHRASWPTDVAARAGQMAVQIAASTPAFHGTHPDCLARRYRALVRDSVERIVRDLLVELRARPQDTVWTPYRDGESLIDAVEGLAVRVSEGDADAEREVRGLFAPTGVLQDTAMTSGWLDQYMALADRLDAIK
jgi:hypothetical protein